MTAHIRFRDWLLERLSEKSTWAGIALVFTAAGRDLPQPVMDAISFWGPLIGAGLISATTTRKDPTT